uniref:Uncharacterized protein n=1 Tax=Anopheles minimus TaxID=112268 RepID=A0A182W9A5_9DIPT
MMAPGLVTGERRLPRYSQPLGQLVAEVVDVDAGGYANFRQSFPEWCEDEVINANLQTGCAATEQLMGLSAWVKVEQALCCVRECETHGCNGEEKGETREGRRPR